MKNILALLIICALAPTLASASYLQLVPNLILEDTVTNNSIEIPASIVNNGDESAINVQMTLLLPEGFTSQSIYIRELQSKENNEKTFTLQIPDDALPGTYVLGLLTHYADANEYPFSSINARLLNYKNPTSSAVSGIMNNIELDKVASTLEITLRNRDEKPHNIKLKLLLPDELQIDQQTAEATIEPGQEKQIQTKITPSGALPGSTYPIIATTSYNENGQQYSTIIRGVITIKQTTKNPMPIPIWVPPAILAVIIGFLIYRRVARKTKRRR